MHATPNGASDGLRSMAEEKIHEVILTDTDEGDPMTFQATLHDGSAISIEVRGDGSNLLLPVNPHPVEKKMGSDPIINDNLFPSKSLSRHRFTRPWRVYSPLASGIEPLELLEPLVPPQAGLNLPLEFH
jgi:hypothetical protein